MIVLREKLNELQLFFLASLILKMFTSFSFQLMSDAVETPFFTSHFDYA